MRLKNKTVNVIFGGGSPFLVGGSHNSGEGSYNACGGSQIRGTGSQTVILDGTQLNLATASK